MAAAALPQRTALLCRYYITSHPPQSMLLCRFLRFPVHPAHTNPQTGGTVTAKTLSAADAAIRSGGGATEIAKLQGLALSIDARRGLDCTGQSPGGEVKIGAVYAQQLSVQTGMKC